MSSSNRSANLVQRTAGHGGARGAAGAGNPLALVLQEPLADGPAGVERTHQILLRRLGVGEEGLAEGR